MSTFTLCRFMQNKTHTADCIYLNNGHLEFNQAVRDILSVEFDLGITFSRPGKHHHNMKFCRVWPNVDQCQTIWEKLTEMYPDYQITLEFNASVCSSHMYDGLVARISTFHNRGEHKQYVCPYGQDVLKQIPRAKAEAKTQASRMKALAERNERVEALAALDTLVGKAREQEALEKQIVANHHKSAVELTHITPFELQILNNFRKMQNAHVNMSEAWFARSGFGTSTKASMKHDIDQLSNAINFVVNYNK